MSNPNLDDLSPLKRALYEIRSLRGRVADLERERSEPIAIVGIGLRFPGDADGPAAFWDLLRAGADCISEIPLSRWSLNDFYDQNADAPGKMYTRHAALLSNPEKFDADFFGISPREAIMMDPQHRLALEVSWEALEHAGYAPGSLSGSRGGVFLSLSNSDYGRMVFRELDQLDAYASTGNLFNAAAGRISYFLGLHGPSLTVDTACSGSLVAVHLAGQSLRSGECGLALAGGVNLILSPEVNINFSKSRMMAPDGHCKSFDASANGYVRGEGCGVVVLKRLREAERDGDHIWGLIRGSAVNQDGRSSGLTAPNGLAQEALLRAALQDAGLKGEQIDYIEAHGTGTALGDPIEAHALAGVYGEGSREQALVVGSVKTNIGHLEAAAGVAGLIKTVLSLEQEYIPKHLHFRSMNPHIDWGGLAVEIPVEGRKWERGRRVRRAGVSSFGFSGTNAHLIVEESPQGAERKREWERSSHLLALSGRSEAALEEMRKRYLEELKGSTAELGDLCYTANAGRTHFEERAFYVGRDREQLLRGLEQGGERGKRRSGEVGVAFLFSGQGAQYAGMGRELYASQPVFRKAIEECGEILRGEWEERLEEVLWGGRTELLGCTEYTQPALFAVEYGLAQVWRSWGVEPAMVAGHSVGEYVAACVAGVYGLEAGLKLIAARGRLMQGCKGRGVMSAVRGSEERVRRALAGRESRVSIAAVNAPGSVVVSGYEEAVEQIERELRMEGLEVKRLEVSHGFHSPQMEEMEEAFEEVARSQAYGAPQVKWISTLEGELVGPGSVDGRYWRKQVRGAVRWAKAMEVMEREGAGAYLEVGPGTTLVGLGRECLEGRGERVWGVSLRSRRGEWEQMLESLGRLYVAGVDPDWEGLDRGYARRRVPLPTYPFQRARFWIESSESGSATIGSSDEWALTCEGVSRQAGQCSLNLDIASYPDRWIMFNMLAVQYICQAFQGLGLYQQSGERHTADTLLEAGNIRPVYRKLLRRWLQHLAANDLLIQENEWYKTPGPLRPARLHELLESTACRFGSDPILEYINACGPVLGDVIQGRLTPVETLFPGGSFERAEGVYERHAMSAYFASLSRAALEGIVRCRAGRKLRILEIGAGTGATTSALLPVLRGRSDVYYFTDVSAAFLRHGEKKFGAYAFVRYRQLDIEQDCAQEFAESSFDVIVATNVIHATKDIRQTLERVKSLLAPGGFLLLCEVTECYPWIETTEALMAGWQAFEDDLRQDHPLLAPQVWNRLLHEAGFAAFEAYPSEDSPAIALGQRFFVIRKAGTAGSGSAPLLRDSEIGQVPRTQTAQAPPEVLNPDLLPSERHEVLVTLIRRHLAEMMRFDSPQEIDRRRRFTDLGLDSLMAIEFRKRLRSALPLKQDLSPTLVFDYPTIETLADHLERDVLGFGVHEEAAVVKTMPNDNLARRADELATLNDSEVEMLLLARLEKL